MNITTPDAATLPFAAELLALVTKRPVMTSREVAFLSRKPHPEVVEDARKLLAALHSEPGNKPRGFERTYLDDAGRQLPEVVLMNGGALILLSGADYFPELLYVMFGDIERQDPAGYDELCKEAQAFMDKAARR